MMMRRLDVTASMYLSNRLPNDDIQTYTTTLKVHTVFCTVYSVERVFRKEFSSICTRVGGSSFGRAHDKEEIYDECLNVE